MGLESEDAHTTELQTVLRIAHALKEATAISCPSSYSPLTPSNATAVIDAISLPSPQPLLPSLLEVGITSGVAFAASQIYQRRAEELKQHIQESVVATCRKAAQSPAALAHVSSPDLLMKRVVPILTDMYFRRLEEWKEEIIQRVKQASELPARTPSGNSRTFNQEYVPLLEHFFEENPFPTHADKIFLAKKSNMQYRQIHVWFQNRRNRTKKDAKPLRKKPTGKSAMKPLGRLYERMRGHMVDSEPQVPKPSKVASSEGTIRTQIAQDNASKDVFTLSSPPHAFPSLYPPTCYYNPFPCKSGPVGLSKPEWRRVADRKHPLSLSTSIDDLVKRFSRLNVRDGTHSSLKLQSRAATVAITVIPSHAPHPSLIVCKHSQSTNFIQLRAFVRAPVSCPKAFQSPSPTSGPATLVPLAAPLKKSELPRKRKTAPLPRRFPGRMQNARRDNSPSESSSTSSCSPCLFSTDSENRSCSF